MAESYPDIGKHLSRIDINVGFARSVVEKMVDGVIWVDRQSEPRAIHIQHPYGMSLVLGDSLNDVADLVVSHLRAGKYRKNDEWLQIDPRCQSLDWDSLIGAITEDEAQEPKNLCPVRYARVNFCFDQERFIELRGSDIVPDGWQVRRAVASDFAVTGSVVPNCFWRSAQQFLSHGGGWCIEQNNVVGAIAFSAYQFEREVELGIETSPIWRKRGLGIAVATAMIRDLIETGFTPVWSCRKENSASYELALKLGFRVTKVIPYYKFPKSGEH